MIEGIVSDVILSDIVKERIRQNELKSAGRFKYTCADIEMTDADCLPVLVEEVGELSRALLESGKLANEKSFDLHGKDMRKELVQVAAIAVAWIERIDNRDKNS